MRGQLVESRVQNGLAIIEIHYPPASIYSYEMMREIDEAILTVRLDAALHVPIVWGKGNKFFAAEPRVKYYCCLHANETLLRLEQPPKLVIAALNGHTVVGGLEIAMACDVRLARRDAGRSSLPELTLGVFPGTGGPQRRPRLVGRSRAIDLMATGRTIFFEEALERDPRIRLPVRAPEEGKQSHRAYQANGVHRHGNPVVRGPGGLPQ